MTRFFRKFGTMRGLAPAERRLALRTIGLVAAVRIALWILPFRWIRNALENSPLLSQPAAAGAWTARQIEWAVRLASRYVPNATCLTRAITAQILLNRAGFANELHIGVARAGTFEAHAWIECEGRVLVGMSERHGEYSRILRIAAGTRA